VTALLLPRREERLLPAVSGLLLAASFPPFHPLILPFVGLVPLAVWVRGLSSDAGGRWSAVRGGLVFGAVYFGALLYWIAAALSWFTWLAIPAFLAVMLVMLGFAATVAWALHRVLHATRTPMWLAVPVVWTAGEWFRAHWPGPLAFPWLGLGTSLTGFPELVGIAEVVGARGVTFWLALVNGLVASLLVRRADGGRVSRRALAAVALVVVLPAAWGVWRAADLEIHEVGRVAVVQPGVPEHVKLDQAAAVDSTLVSLDRLMPRIAPGSVSLVVLPEMLFEVDPRGPDGRVLAARLQGHARETGAPVLFGGLGGDVGADGGAGRFNSAFLMEPQGLTPFRYDKRHLVPGVERVPLVPGRWLDGGSRFGGFGVGQGWPLAEVDGARYGVLVCYESSYPQLSRAFRREGADILVNITNDAWFGQEPWWSRTTVLWQHPAHLVMRAIENRMGVVRSANTGISLFVDPIGRAYGAAGLFRPDVSEAPVYTTAVSTFYTRVGDLAGHGSALAAALLLLAPFAGWSRRPSPRLDPGRSPH
jgi:apolipoprotein N-acyltransferase